MRKEYEERNLRKKSWKTPLSTDNLFEKEKFLTLPENLRSNLRGSIPIGSNSIDGNDDADKSAIRSYVLERRSILSYEELESKSKLICECLTLLDIFNSSRRVAIYHSVNNEVKTERIFHEAVAGGKEVYFPRVSGSDLKFHIINNLDQLKPGAFGVLEPGPESSEIRPEDLDIIIVPGVAFDYTGGRVGYGKGYYDRVLESINTDKIIGLSYNFQLFDEVPQDITDMNVGIIVSEKGIIYCSTNQGGK